MLFFSNLSRNWLGRNIERLRRTFFRCLLPWVHDWSGVDIQSWLEEVRALLSLVWTLQFPQKTLSCTVSILSQREDGLEDSPNIFFHFMHKSRAVGHSRVFPPLPQGKLVTFLELIMNVFHLIRKEECSWVDQWMALSQLFISGTEHARWGRIPHPNWWLWPIGDSLLMFTLVQWYLCPSFWQNGSYLI